MTIKYLDEIGIPSAAPPVLAGRPFRWLDDHGRPIGKRAKLALDNTWLIYMNGSTLECGEWLEIFHADHREGVLAIVLDVARDYERRPATAYAVEGFRAQVVGAVRDAMTRDRAL